MGSTVILDNTTSAGDTSAPLELATHGVMEVSCKLEGKNTITGVKDYIHICITRFGCPLFRRPTDSARSAAAPTTVWSHIEKHLQIQFSP